MDEQQWRRVRGLKQLLHDGVDRGTTFVEKHHKLAIDKPFSVLESMPDIGEPARQAHQIYNSVLSVTYESIRTVNRGADRVTGWALDRLEE